MATAKKVSKESNSESPSIDITITISMPNGDSESYNAAILNPSGCIMKSHMNANTVYSNLIAGMKGRYGEKHIKV